MQGDNKYIIEGFKVRKDKKEVIDNLRSASLRIKLTKSKLWKDSKFGKRKNKYLRHKIKESEELVQIDSECKKEAEE